MNMYKKNVMVYAVVALLAISAGAIEAMYNGEGGNTSEEDPYFIAFQESSGPDSRLTEQRRNPNGASFQELGIQGGGGGYSDDEDEFASTYNSRNNRTNQSQLQQPTYYQVEPLVVFNDSSSNIRMTHTQSARETVEFQASQVQGGGGFSDDDGSDNESYGSGEWSPPSSPPPVRLQRTHYQRPSGTHAGNHDFSSSSFHFSSSGPAVPSSSFGASMPTPSAPSFSLMPKDDPSFDSGMRIGRKRPPTCGILGSVAVAVIAFVSWRALFGKKKQPSHHYRPLPRPRPPRK